MPYFYYILTATINDITVSYCTKTHLYSKNLIHDDFRKFIEEKYGYVTNDIKIKKISKSTFYKSKIPEVFFLA